MNDFEYFSSLYKPLHLYHEIRVGDRRVPVLASASYRIDPDGSKEICNLKYWLFGDKRSLRKLEPFYDKLMEILTNKAFGIIGDRVLKF